MELKNLMTILKRYFYKDYLIIQHKDLKNIYTATAERWGMSFREFVYFLLDIYAFSEYDVVKNVYLFY